MKKPNIITLLTDFGYGDPYVAAMKGVIYTINPHVNIIDITHNVPPHNIRAGAIILWSTYKYFPKGTIHLVVVDPGVGTKRKPIVIYSKNYIFIGPDNGVLTLAANEDGIEKTYEIISNTKYLKREISFTFHGRDIFAPIAAYISRGVSINELAKETSLTFSLNIPKYTIKNSQIIGEIIYIDHFGNLITNIPKGIAEKILAFYRNYEVNIKNKVISAKFVKAYGNAKEGEPLLIINSFNLLELSINLGNAAQRYAANVGDKIIIKY